MPFGYKREYPDFAACVRAQMERGHSEESAKKICGALKRDTERKPKRASASLLRRLLRGSK